MNKKIIFSFIVSSVIFGFGFSSKSYQQHCLDKEKLLQETVTDTQDLHANSTLKLMVGSAGFMKDISKEVKGNSLIDAIKLGRAGIVIMTMLRNDFYVKDIDKKKLEEALSVADSFSIGNNEIIQLLKRAIDKAKNPHCYF